MDNILGHVKTQKVRLWVRIMCRAREASNKRQGTAFLDENIHHYSYTFTPTNTHSHSPQALKQAIFFLSNYSRIVFAPKTSLMASIIVNQEDFRFLPKFVYPQGLKNHQKTNKCVRIISHLYILDFYSSIFYVLYELNQSEKTYCTTLLLSSSI